MGPEVRIRDYKVSDIGRIAVLLGELGYPHTVDFFKRRFEILDESDLDRVLVALQELDIVGLATLHFLPLPHLDGDLCRVVALVVASSARRKGVGAKLMARAEEIARQRGCVKMEITSGAHRTDAHAFYEAIGYEEASKRFVKILKK